MVKSCFLQHVRILRGRQGCPNLVCIVVSKTVFGNEISNFKTFMTTDSIGNFCEMAYLHVKTCVTLKSVGKFFLKRVELGRNPTDDLCNSSKWPFWQASMKIHWILVYWDARNSLSYNLVIPFKDGVTFAVTTATQSLQRCYLESVADMTNVAVTECHFLSKISK